MGGPRAQGLSLESSSTTHAKRATRACRLHLRQEAAGEDCEEVRVGGGRQECGAEEVSWGDRGRRADYQEVGMGRLGEQRFGDYVPHFLHPSVHVK